MDKNIKVIFLDFDGVITTLNSGYRLDYDKVDMIKEIIDKTDAKLVISSSWKSYDLKSTIEDLKKSGFTLCDHIIDITPSLGIFKYNNNDGEARTEFHIPRGIEIDFWLEHTNYNVLNYVILDDFDDMLYVQKDNFIQTDMYNGLNDNDVKKAIEILNNENKLINNI